MTDKIEIYGIGYSDDLLAARWTRNGVLEVGEGSDEIPADVRAALALLIAPELRAQMSCICGFPGNGEYDAMRAERDKLGEAVGGLASANEVYQREVAALRARLADHESDMSASLDKGFEFALDTLERAFPGTKYCGADGSDSWEGDAAGTLWNFLCAANLIDKETNVPIVAVLRARVAELEVKG